MRENRKKGFTLVELVVVIAIIAILSAITVPTTIHFVEKAKQSNRISLMQAVAKDAYSLVSRNDSNDITDGATLVAKLKSEQRYDIDDLVGVDSDVAAATNQALPNGEVITIFFERDNSGNGRVVLRYYVNKKYVDISKEYRDII